jgi:cytochrome b6-f complex iron-sulfur subunit
MADKRKLSVEEMLAAARAEKSGANPAPTPPKAAETPVEPSQAAPESTAEPASAPQAPSVGSLPAKPAKGLSVAEMLAAARGEKSAPKAAAPAAPKPAAAVAAKPPASAATTAAKAAPEKAAGPVVKDTASILAAARGKTAKPGPVSKAAAPAVAGKPAKTKLEVPPMPEKPGYAVPAPAPAPVGTAASRRGFLAGFTAAMAVLFQSSLALGFTSMAVTGVLWVLGFARFMFPNVLIEPPTKFKVGFPDDYGPGQVQTKFIPQFGVWVVRYEYEGQPMIYAIKSVCTHLGCTPNWLEGEQKFKCPCHGSGFYKDGINFEGPAPRPLERYAISKADDGQLEVDKSRTFQEELGQWKYTASYVTV